MSSSSRDWNKPVGIILMACGLAVVLVALAFLLALLILPEAAPGFAGDKFYQPTPTTLSSYLPSLLHLAIGVALIVRGILLLRRHRRDKLLIAGSRPRPATQQTSIAPDRSPIPLALRTIPGVGYRAFVAWRYLLVRTPRVTPQVVALLAGMIGLRVLLYFVIGMEFVPDDRSSTMAIAGFIFDGIIIISYFFGIIRHSWLIAVMFVLCALNFLHAVELDRLAVHGKVFDLEAARMVRQAAGGAMIGAGVGAFLWAFLGTLRAGFTFFTTVPVAGVWVGTAALVIVLAVMSGFETDLRDKILGSNAHIQVTKEDGEFVEWREVKKKIDNIPGVVASTPYAVSEVVIAANNNGMNVIIKGIDPATVAQVTNLVSNLEDKDAMRRLEPLIDLGADRTLVEPAKHTKPDSVDPPPPDMITGGDPIDFSGDQGSGAPPPAPPDPGAGSGSGLSSPPMPDPYGGDARLLTELEDRVLDLLDSPLIDWMVGYEEEPIVRIIDTEPTMSRRTQALPGILVGRELVKQTHLYTGEEVRVVSPLSDPSNPDATGTPIPFNRDYRVAGVFFTGMYEYDLKFVYVTLDSLQDFLDRGDGVDGIEIRIESGDDTGRYVPSKTDPGLIREALGPGYRVQDWRELNRSLFAALKLEKIAMFLVLGIVILVASFSIIGNLIMVVVEKGREIALLKTLGASDVGVMQLFAVQGMIIGLIGTALGIATGLTVCVLMEKFGLPLNPDVYYIDRLPIHVDPESVIAAAITGVLISIGATLYPALLAARVRPAIGMRH